MNISKNPMPHHDSNNMIEELTTFVTDGSEEFVLLVGPITSLDEVDLALDSRVGLNSALSVQIHPSIRSEQIVNACRNLVPSVLFLLVANVETQCYGSLWLEFH